MNRTIHTKGDEKLNRQHVLNLKVKSAQGKWHLWNCEGSGISLAFTYHLSILLNRTQTETKILFNKANVLQTVNCDISKKIHPITVHLML